MKPLRTLVAVALLALVSAGQAQAQLSRPERPFRGLFGNGVENTSQLLTASGSLGTGWDNNIVADLFGNNRFRPSDLTRDFRGSATTASGALSYSFTETAFSFGATAGTTGRYYPSLTTPFIRRSYANIGASAALGAGFTLQANGSYQPFNLRALAPLLFDPVLGDPSAVDIDTPASREHFFSYSAGAAYNRRLSRSDNFNVNYNYGARTTITQTGSLGRQSAGAGYSRTLTRDLALQLGYQYSEARFSLGSDRRFQNHGINVGLNFNRQLSFSRRTTVSFGSGTSAARSSINDRLRFRATGNARLNHEIGRSWMAAATYNRNLQFIEAWPEPVFSDAFAASLSGSVNRRTQLQLLASAMRGNGQLQSSTSGRRVAQQGASATLSIAANRHVTTGVTYTYYHQEFGAGVILPPGFVNNFDRQSVRAFVSVWAPVYQRARRP